MMDWNGFGAVVTGGASGLGAATAAKLASDGLKVVLFDLNADKGEAHAQAISGHFVSVNVADPSSVAKGVEAAKAHVGDIRVLVNCAGIGGAAKTVSRGQAHDPELFQKTIAVNLIGSFNCASQLAANMAALDPIGSDGARGAIVNTASVAAYDGQVGQLAYAASKGGIVGMTLPIARDFASMGIRVNTIAPGLINTPMLQGLPEPARESLAATVLFPQRLGEATEIARVAQMLIENDYMNGETIRMDGGIRMQPK